MGADRGLERPHRLGRLRPGVGGHADEHELARRHPGLGGGGRARRPRSRARRRTRPASSWRNASSSSWATAAGAGGAGRLVRCSGRPRAAGGAGPGPRSPGTWDGASAWHGLSCGGVSRGRARRDRRHRLVRRAGAAGRAPRRAPVGPSTGATRGPWAQRRRPVGDARIGPRAASPRRLSTVDPKPRTRTVGAHASLQASWISDDAPCGCGARWRVAPAVPGAAPTAPPPTPGVPPPPRVRRRAAAPPAPAPDAAAFAVRSSELCRARRLLFERPHPRTRPARRAPSRARLRGARGRPGPRRRARRAPAGAPSPACSTEATFSAARRSSVVRLAAIAPSSARVWAVPAGLGGLLHGRTPSALLRSISASRGRWPRRCRRCGPRARRCPPRCWCGPRRAGGRTARASAPAPLPRSSSARTWFAAVSSIARVCVDGGAVELEQPLLRDVEHAAARGLELGHRAARPRARARAGSRRAVRACAPAPPAPTRSRRRARCGRPRPTPRTPASARRAPAPSPRSGTGGGRRRSARAGSRAVRSPRTPTRCAPRARARAPFDGCQRVDALGLDVAAHAGRPSRAPGSR